MFRLALIFASLLVVGCSGDRGKEGPQGEPGSMGEQGDPGGPGTMGTMGDPGRPGEQGPAGPRGPNGDTGDQGPRGDQGNKGDPGSSGTDGLNCWDLNGNGSCDDLAGALGDEDVNGDDACDALDCQGPKGDTGTPGGPGADGVHCWDLDEDDACDDLGGAPGDEDTNNDDVCDVLDCKGETGAKGDPGSYVVLDGNDTLLGDLISMEGNKLIVKDSNGVFLAYNLDSGVVTHTEGTLSDEIHYEMGGCAGTPLQRTGGIHKLVGAAMFNNGEMFRRVKPIVSTTSTSRRDDSGVCGPASHMGDLMTLEFVGAKPSDAVLPLQIQ